MYQVSQTLESSVRWGPPARGIADRAERPGTDATIMDCRALRDLKGSAPGAVSHTVVHIAGCRVTAVH